MWQMGKEEVAGTTSRDTWRRLVQGIAIFFLLTSQAWADITCNCRQESIAQHASQIAHSCCPSTHRSSSDRNEECADRSGYSLPIFTAEEAPGANNQSCSNEFVDLSQNTRTCCQSSPQSDAQEMTILLQDPVQVISARLPINLDTASSFEFTYRDFHQHCHARPLYLSFSCFLI